MIYKVLYQKNKIVNPRRETTQTLCRSITQRHSGMSTQDTFIGTCSRCGHSSMDETNKKSVAMITSVSKLTKNSTYRKY